MEEQRESVSQSLSASLGKQQKGCSGSNLNSNSLNLNHAFNSCERN